MRKKGKHKELIKKLIAPSLVSITSSHSLINQIGLYLNHEDNFDQTKTRPIKQQKRTVRLTAKTKKSQKIPLRNSKQEIRIKTTNHSRESNMRATKTSLVVKLPQQERRDFSSQERHLDYFNKNHIQTDSKEQNDMLMERDIEYIVTER